MEFKKMRLIHPSQGNKNCLRAEQAQEVCDWLNEDLSRHPEWRNFFLSFPDEGVKDALYLYFKGNQWHLNPEPAQPGNDDRFIRV